MDSPIYKEERNGYTIKIFTDDDPDNPRTWSNIGKMVCWHRNLLLGDEMPKESPVEFLCDLLGLNRDEYEDSRSTLIYLLSSFDMKEKIIILPLYFYNHGGITMRTTPFGDRWDSGQVGFIYITKEDAKKERLSEKDALRCLQSEVETYDDYLIGNVHGFQVCNEDNDVLESCWGFYPTHGDNPDYTYCLSEARDMADRLAEERQTEQDIASQLLAIATAHE
jgi:hypothetical protein